MHPIEIEIIKFRYNKYLTSNIQSLKQKKVKLFQFRFNKYSASDKNHPEGLE